MGYCQLTSYCRLTFADIRCQCNFYKKSNHLLFFRASDMTHIVVAQAKVLLTTAIFSLPFALEYGEQLRFEKFVASQLLYK